MILLVSLGPVAFARPPARDSVDSPPHLVERYRPRPTDLVIVDNPVPDEWKTKTCTDPGIVDANMPSDQRWESVGGDWAMGAIFEDWKAARQSGEAKIPMVQWISNEFHGPEGLDCAKIGNDACTEIVQCDDVTNPAAYFILNSFSTLHSLARDARTEMDFTRGSISLNSFMSKFCPKKQPDMALEIFKTIIDTALMVSMMGSGLLWNKIIRPRGAFTGDDRGWFKDSFNAGIAFAYNLAKDTKKGATDMLSAQSQMEEQKTIYFQQMMDMMESVNAYMFSGEDASMSELMGALWEGRAMPNNNLGFDAKEFDNELRGMVYSKMIPQAWYINPDKEYSPIVLETDDACDGSSRTMTEKYIVGDTVEKTRVCLDGVTYYVISAAPRKDNCGSRINCIATKDPWFATLPGGSHDDLDGEQWGAIKLEHIVRSVRDGWVANGNKNGFKQNEEPDTQNLSGWFDSLSIAAPGYWDVPFCPKDRFNDILHRMAGVNAPPVPFWPCGE